MKDRTLTPSQREAVASMLVRAAARFSAAEKAALREDAASGDFDNSFDGVVTGIFHILDGFVLATTGQHRSMGLADAPTVMASVLAKLRAAGLEAPSLYELTELNRQRNTSVHGGVAESPFRSNDVADAVDIGRELQRCVSEYLRKADILP